MSTRVVLLVILLGVAFTAPLTPRTPMNQAFDDLLFNMVNDPEFQHPLGALNGFTPVYKVSSSELTSENPNAFLAELKAQLPHITEEKSGMAIVGTCLKVTDLVQYVHEIFEAVPQENIYRATLVVITYFKRGFKIASGVGSIKADRPIGQYKKIHNLKTSRYSIISFTSDPDIEVAQVGTFSAEEMVMKKDASKAMWLKLKVARGSQMFDFLFAKAPTRLGQSFTGVLDAITAVAQAWKAVADAFKTVNKKTLMSITRGKGFSTYRASSRLIRSIGINTAFWQDYMKNLMIITDLEKNPKAREQAHVFLSMGEFMPDQAWYFNEATFDKNTGGNTDSVVCMSNLDLSTNKANVLVVSSVATFDLDPDVYIYEQFKSVAGGIYQNTKEVRHNVRRDLTDSDVRAIGALTMLNAINVMTKVFNIPFNLPVEQPTDL